AVPPKLELIVVSVLLGALSVTVKIRSAPSVTVGVPERLTVALSLSLIFAVGGVGTASVIWGSPVMLPSVTLTDSLASTRPSSVVGTVIVAVVARAGIVTLVVVLV